MRQQLIKGIGGKLWVEFNSRPTAVYATIKRGSGNNLAVPMVDVECGLDATVGTFDISATVREEAKAVPVTLAFGSNPKAGVTMEMLTPHGLKQANYLSYWYYISDVAHTAVFVFRNPFQIAPEANTTFSSCRAFVELTGEQCERIEENCRAVFTATIDNESVVKEVIYDVGLRTADNPASPKDLLMKWADYRYSETREWQYEQGAPAVDAAWDDVQLDVRAFGRNPNRIRDTGPLIPLIVNRAAKNLGVYGIVPPLWLNNPLDFIKLVDNDYANLFAKAMASCGWYDNEDFGTTVNDDTKGKVSTIILSR